MELVSAIVPTLNEEKYLEACLRALRKQTYPALEIIVYDGCSQDFTVRIAKLYADKVIVKHSTPAQARNWAAKVARGKYLLFLDADVILHPYYVSLALRACKNKRAAVVLGNAKPTKKGFKAYWLEFLFGLTRKISSWLIPASIGGVVFFIKRRVLKQVRFQNVVGEDTRFLRWAASMYKVIYEPKCKYWVSTRRFDQLGYLKELLKMGLGWLADLLNLRRKNFASYQVVR